MRRVIKLFFVAMTLLLSCIDLKAQSTASAIVSATIVTPLTINSGLSIGYETLSSKTSVAYLTAADFSIGAGVEDVFALTIPQTVVLMNALGIEKMSAAILKTSQQEIVHHGKQHCRIDAGLSVENIHVPGRYTSQAFDVTVNFN